jgi:DNA-binding NarL/FixJ family response regulator
MKALIITSSEFLREQIASNLPREWKSGISFATGFLEASWHAVARSPDVVILDLDLPDAADLNLLRNTRVLNPSAFIVVLASNLLFAQTCHRAGADLFLRLDDYPLYLRRSLASLEVPAFLEEQMA